MPIPAPKPQEPRQSFMQRCMSDQTMVDEYREAPQRWAVCTTKWEERRKDEDELQRRLD